VFERKECYGYDDLIKCARGELFGLGNARLPLPPMLMLDRIINISETGGSFGNGEITAEFDINPDLWFFKCHFESDPVMPGCLGMDAMWQMVGFFLGWIGLPGKGRARGVGEIKFTGEVLQVAKKVSYQLNVKRTIARKLIMGIADGIMSVDGVQAIVAKDVRVMLHGSSPSS